MTTDGCESVSLQEMLGGFVVQNSVQETIPSRRIIVVDDESVIADTLVAILKLSGFRALALYNGESALELISVSVPDLLITDVCMPGMNGVELAIRVREKYPDCKVLLFSGHASTELFEQARSQGHDFELLRKPVHPRDLLDRISV